MQQETVSESKSNIFMIFDFVLLCASFYDVLIIMNSNNNACLGSGVIGIPMTLFLYLLVIFASLVILYLYFLKLHNNGRILDVFHRLHGDESSFFVPHDLELSNQELSYIVKKAEQWRGADGERRKVYFLLLFQKGVSTRKSKGTPDNVLT